MSERPILVTGGAGFIGSHTCKRFGAEGFLPIAYDNLSTGNRKSVRWGPLVEADIADTATFAAVCERYQPVAVVHFAASAYVGNRSSIRRNTTAPTSPERSRSCAHAAKRACATWCSRAVAPCTATSWRRRSTRVRLLRQSALTAGPN